VVFLRRNGANAALAREHAITPEKFDVDAYMKYAAEADPAEAYALHNAATTLRALAWGDRIIGGGDERNPNVRLLTHEIGWGGHAATVWRRCVRLEEEYYEAFDELGMCLALRGTALLMLANQYRNMARTDQQMALAIRTDRARRADWKEAERNLLEAQRLSRRLKRDDSVPAEHLDLLRKQIAAAERGVILVPKPPWLMQAPPPRPPGQGS